MNLNLNDPDSIIAWWREFPERHWDYLDVFAKQPQFMAAVRQARMRIRSDPQLAPILDRAVSSGADRRRAMAALMTRARDLEVDDEAFDPGAYGSH